MIHSAQQVSGASTGDAPAATTNGDNYVLAWTRNDQSIEWTTCPTVNNQNSYRWVPVKPVTNAFSSGGPALTHFNGKVWLAWKGESTDPRIFLASLNGAAWSAGTPLSNAGTSAAPALTATGPALFLAFKGEHDDTIYWAKSTDGTTWEGRTAVPGALSSDTPALAAFNGTVYLAWKGAKDNTIWLSEYTDANGWGKATVLPDNMRTSAGPSLGVGDTGNVHIVFKGESDTAVWTSSRPSGGSSWSTPGKFFKIGTSARPAVASQLSANTEILLTWKDGADTDLWAAPLDGLGLSIPAPTGSAQKTMTWQVPVTGFGSACNSANFSSTLVLQDNGSVKFTGQYQDTGSIPIFDCPGQSYEVVVALAFPKQHKILTLTHSNNNVPTGSQRDTWDITGTSADVKNYWSEIGTTICHASCNNNTDFGGWLGNFISSLEADIADVLQVAGEVIEVVAMIA